MLLKQALIQTCRCGQAMEFPEGEVKAKCRCGANWECGSEGYWYIKNLITPFVPILPKPVVVVCSLVPCSVRSRADRYKNYPNSKRRRKAGTRC